MFGLVFVNCGLGYGIRRRFEEEVVLRVLMSEERMLIFGSWIRVPLSLEVEDEDVRVRVLLGCSS